MMFIIVWLMRVDFSGAATLAFLVFVAAGITDWLDGFYARKLGLVSNFGILMDALTDKILMLGLMVALLEFPESFRGLVPAEWDVWMVSIYLVLLILGRELMITGLRLVAATKGVVMSAESAGKQKTVTQIIAVGGFLLFGAIVKDFASWGLPAADVVGLVVLWIGRGTFWLCTFMTLYSGAKYFKKYGELVFTDSGKGAS